MIDSGTYNWNFMCGYRHCDFKGARGSQGSLSLAVKLGWIGLIAALVSGVLAVFGDAEAGRIGTAVSSTIVPILFLISAKSVKNNS